MIKRLLAALALLASAGAQAEWQEASSKHFVVLADDSPDRVRQFTQRLEEFDGAIRVLLGVNDPAISPSSRVTVFVTRDENEVRRLLGAQNSNVGGFYIPRASGSVAFVPRSSGDTRFTTNLILFHEYAHHLMFSSWSGAPTPAWLIEGFAEFVATARARSDGGVVVGAAPAGREWHMLEYQMLPIQRLLAASPGALKGEESLVFYSRSWLLTHYLLLDPARRKLFAQYLAAINAGATPLKAAEAFGPLPALETALNSYAKKLRLTGLEIPKDKLPPAGEVQVRTLRAGEAAMMPVRLQSSRGVNEKTAAETAALARRLAQPHSGDVAVQVALAEAEYDAKAFAAADAAATRALALDPKSVDAMIYRSLARMALAQAAKTTDAAEWTRIRAPLLEANKLDPENPWPLVLYHRSFPAQGRAATKNAADGMIYAQALAPFDVSLGLTAAQIQLDRGKTDAARALLRPIAFNPHRGGAAALAGKVLAGIDGGGAAGGLAAFSGAKPEEEGEDGEGEKKK